RYNPNFPQPQGGVEVVRQQRVLLTHDTGRFIVMGAVGPLGPDANGQPTPPRHNPPVTAFQSYYLTELFARLGENTGNPQNHEDVVEINQRAGMYFFRMNRKIALVTALFAGFFAYEQYWANNAIKPVVDARAGSAQHTVDLKDLLTPEAGK